MSHQCLKLVAGLSRRAHLLSLLAAVAFPFLGNSAAPAADAVIDPAHPESLQRGIEAAVARGDKHIVIPPGVYRVPPSVPSQPTWHLYFRDLQDVEIDGTGATLILTDGQRNGIAFVGCRGITFRGARIQRAEVPFSQGTIAAIDPGGKYVDVRIDKGYPADLLDRAKFDHFWSGLFSADGTEIIGTMRATEPLDLKQLEPGLFHIRLNDTIQMIPVPVTVGTHLAWRGTVHEELRAGNCTGAKFIDLTVAGGAGFVFHELDGEGGNLYRGCKITYPPLPEGAVDKPLFATAADGLHSSDVVKGPTIENCLFEGIGDDAIAIRGTYAMADQAGGKRIVGWVYHFLHDKLFCRPGETLRLYDKNAVLVGEAVVTAVHALPGYRPATKPAVVYRWLGEPEKDSFVEILLDRDVPADFAGGFFTNANRVGSGYVVRGCTIRSSSARGVMAKASDGLIEDCTFEKLSRAGVEFMAEMEIWTEADYARNVTIRRNTFRKVSLNRQPGYLRHPGAIAIYNQLVVDKTDLDTGRRQSFYVPAPGGHRHIVIEDNTIEDVNGPNLLITSAQDVRVRNNRFVRPMTGDNGVGVPKGVDVHSLVWLTQSSGIDFSGNQVIQPGSWMKKLVTATPTAQGTGFDAGFQTSRP